MNYKRESMTDLVFHLFVLILIFKSYLLLLGRHIHATAHVEITRQLWGVSYFLSLWDPGLKLKSSCLHSKAFTN